VTPPHCQGLGAAGVFGVTTTRSAAHFIKLYPNTLLRRSFPPNDLQTGKNCDRSTNRIDFRDFPGVVLSYQAWLIPRIVRPSDKPVSRDRPIVIVFNPAETT
jgi:hypothetical protein